ncbi:Rossmann-fold NAD(+)-binding protein [Colletotrichum incanum]|nr:Rossmann-fold NAD(+)-binding protein [Colletotrichum incanum]
MKHQKHIHKAQLIVKEEDTRRQRVTKQVLLDENLTLREQLAEKEAQISQLSDKFDQARSDLDSVKTTNRDQETQLKAQRREFDHIKAELESLNSMSQESTKVLAEKLALSREVNAMKPELEHLRSQVAHQQNAIAEKLELERQLNMAEVELAAEKRAREQQAAQTEGDRKTEDELRRKLKDAEKKLTAEKREKEQLQEELEAAVSAAKAGQENTKVERELTKRLQELEKTLLAEKREKEKIRKEGEVALSEAQAQNEMLEQRLDTVKTKLRNTQEELKAVRAELVARPVPAPTAQPAARAGGAKAQVGRKRRVEELSINDMSIGTPEEITRGRRPAKKKGLEQTLLGEKSLFSITPFLAKSKTLHVEDAVAEEDDEQNEADVSYIPLAHQSHSQSQEVEVEAEVEPEAEAEAEEVEEAEVPEEKPTKSTKAKSKTKTEGEAKKPRGRPKKALAEASPNMPVQVAPAAVSKPSAKASSPLEQVPEEPETEQQEEEVVPKATGPGKKAALPAATAVGGGDHETKKKKRKLGGDSATLFDDDDGEVAPAAAKRPGKAAMGAGKALGKTHLSTVRNAGAFGKKTFSPLKKDRRGVGASFLA